MAKKKSGGEPVLKPKIFKGLSEKRMKQSSSGGDRVVIKKNDTVPVQFLTDLKGFREIDQHQFQDAGRWNYVPCVGDNCPLCDDDDRDVSKTQYRFFANVYNLKEKKVQVLEGPKDLSRRIALRFKRKPKTFLNRVFDVSKIDGTPVSYQMELAEEDAVKVKGLKLIDLDAYILGELKRYYGDELPSSADVEDEDDEDEEDDDEEAEDDDDDDDDSDDDEDDDDEDDDEEDDDDDDDEEEDDDEDDDDDDDDDDDEEEDEKPAPRGRKPGVKGKAAPKAAAKKAPAKTTAKKPAAKAKAPAKSAARTPAKGKGRGKK